MRAGALPTDYDCNLKTAASRPRRTYVRSEKLCASRFFGVFLALALPQTALIAEPFAARRSPFAEPFAAESPGAATRRQL